MSSIEIALPLETPTGKYRAIASLSDEYVLGQTSFLVEDFVPDRIKVEVTTDRDEYQMGDRMKIAVEGKMLYGAPAAGLKVKTEIIFSPEDFRPDGYASFSFGVKGPKPSIKRIPLKETTLSAKGVVDVSHIIEPGHRPPGRLAAQIWVTVSEKGGRGVSSYVEAMINPYPRFVGIKTGLEGYAKTDEPVKATVVLLQPDGSRTMADSILLHFSRLVYNSMLRQQSDGSYRFVSERTEEPIDSAWLAVGPDGVQTSFVPKDYGRYRITASDQEGGHAASVEFFASGWGRVPWAMDEPDRLKLDLDQTGFSPGGKAMLQVRAPFSGRLLLTVENQTVQEYLIVDLTDNTAEIEIPVKRDYAPNVYISATLIRPAAEITKGTAARAYGLIPLIVSAVDRQLDVTLSSPEEIRPNSKLSIEIQTNGSDLTQLTIAAVDAGILQLTDDESPDPFEFFYGKRRPALDGYDLYSQIYPETEQAKSHLSPPGGKSSFRSKRHLSPFQARRINVVSLWSGVLEVDSTGGTSVTFDVPQFGGQLQIVAVVADGDQFGQASTSTLVREPIVLQESFPRFVAPGDRVDGLVTVFNGFDTTTTINLVATVGGQARLVSKKAEQLRLEPGEQGLIKFPIIAEEAPGLINITISATAGVERTKVSFEMANRPPGPLTVKFGSGAVTGAASALFTIPADWIEGTAEYFLRTSSLTSLQVTRNIEYLLRYPYGCVEQTTSALFPLLYFDDLARLVRPELLGGHAHEYFIAEGIERLLRFQNTDGAFTYWPGIARVHNWSSIYAAHFLIEAQAAGYEIDKNDYKRTLKFLESVARDKLLSDLTIEHRIYACLALAKAGKLDRKLFNFLAGVNTERLPRYSTYQLAMALALAGDLPRARELVPFEIQPDLSPPENGGNFSSAVRTEAMLLDLLVEINPQSPSTAALAKSLLQSSRLNRWYNTQATAFALIALGKYFNRLEPVAFEGDIVIESGNSYPIDTAEFVLTDDIGGRQISIAIDGDGPCFYYWQASGIPTKADMTGYERGIRVKREYLGANGAAVDLSDIKLGTQLVGHITIESTDKSLKNVVIADLLPAGLEIENARLANSPVMAWLPKNMSRPEYQDIRDDRLLMFVSLPSKRTLHFYYGLRAIAAGQFVLPPVAAECMYNPLIAGASSSNRVIIKGGD